MEVKIKLISPLAKVPTRGSEEAAGYDLYAAIDEPIMLQPHTTTKIPTGFAIAIPNGYSGEIYPRSGIASQDGLRLANCVGLIDSDYRGEIVIALHNDFDEAEVITPGERIAQIVLREYKEADFLVIEELEATARGNGGFGSTGRS